MRYGIAALILVLVAGLLYGLHTKAVRDANASGKAEGVATATIECIESIDKAISDANKARTKIERNNLQLPTPDIDRKLSINWLRHED